MGWSSFFPLEWSDIKNEVVLWCNNGELRGETEELYEEYIYEGDYEEYRFICQKCGREKKSAKTRNDRSIDETLFQKILNRKWWFVCMIRLNSRIKNSLN